MTQVWTIVTVSAEDLDPDDNPAAVYVGPSLQGVIDTFLHDVASYYEAILAEPSDGILYLQARKMLRGLNPERSDEPSPFAWFVHQDGAREHGITHLMLSCHDLQTGSKWPGVETEEYSWYEG